MKLTYLLVLLDQFQVVVYPILLVYLNLGNVVYLVHVQMLDFQVQGINDNDQILSHDF